MWDIKSCTLEEQWSRAANFHLNHVGYKAERVRKAIADAVAFI